MSMLEAKPVADSDDDKEDWIYNINPSSANPVSIKIQTQGYMDQLKEAVFNEVIKRIEKNMDVNAADILDKARDRLKDLRRDSSLILLALKPICLLFVVDICLEVPMNI